MAADNSEEEVSDAEMMVRNYINGNLSEVKAALNNQGSKMAAVGLFIAALTEMKERCTKSDVDMFCRRVASWQ